MGKDHKNQQFQQSNSILVFHANSLISLHVIDTGMTTYRALPNILEVSVKGILTSFTLFILFSVGESENGEHCNNM